MAAAALRGLAPLHVVLIAFAAQATFPLLLLIDPALPVLAGVAAIGAVLPLLLLKTWRARLLGAAAMVLVGTYTALVAAEGLAHAVFNTCLQ
ncbi:hypothetical protein [Sphingomonas sp.]|uniref:hypothetical protein n=1 Tax=Sphingomonas sp. TaxID=28214 RepID=UPI002DD6AD1A|nr:hypothetical protein [Sphingomonas sp.]